MQPFTTYTIPDSLPDQTPISGAWLTLVLHQPPSTEEKVFISKIVAALHADFDRQVTLLIAGPKHPLIYADQMPSHTRLVISFGVPPEDIGLWLDLKTTGIRILERFTFIQTLPVAELTKQSQAKKELWNAMLTFMDHD